MNKQEAAKELYRRKIQAENRYTGNEWSKGHQNGLCEGLQDAIKVVEQIDDTEKPTVPQFVADWYEEHKDDFEHCIHEEPEIIRKKIAFDDLDDFHNWFNFASNKPVETLVKMKLYGYEIEKEKLYEVFLKDVGIKLAVITSDYKDKSQFTDKEIKEYGFNKLDMYEVKEIKE